MQSQFQEQSYRPRVADEFIQHLHSKWTRRVACQNECRPPESCSCQRTIVDVKAIEKWWSEQLAESPGLTRGHIFLDEMPSTSYQTFPPAYQDIFSGEGCCVRVLSLLLQQGRDYLINLFQYGTMHDRYLMRGGNYQVLREILLKRMRREDVDTIVRDFDRDKWAYCPMELTLGMTFNAHGTKVIPPFCMKIRLPDKGGTASIYWVAVQKDLVSNDALARTLRDSLYHDKEFGECYQMILKSYAGDKESVFDLEKLAFTGLNSKKDVPILQYLGSYTHDYGEGGHMGKTYNILLEYGENDLYQAWADETNVPPVRAQEILRTWNSLFEIAKAIRHVHYLEVPRGGGSEPRRFHGWHADIKPDNILSIRGQLKLSDIGFSSFAPVIKGNARSVPTELVRGFTDTYGAPEVFRMKRADGTLSGVTQAIDIWSFGCVLSVAATWIVLGFQGIRQYEQLRQQATSNWQNGRRYDRFHDGTKALPEIRYWHDYLRNHLRTSDNTTERVLTLIEDHLLREEPSQRPDSGTLCSELRTLHNRAQLEIRDPPQLPREIDVAVFRDPPNHHMAMTTWSFSAGTQKSQDILSISNSSSHRREGDSSTLPTSSGATRLEVHTDKQTRDLEYNDATTTYSIDSAPDDVERDYISAFAQRLLQDVGNASAVTNISKIPSSYISDALRSFSWRLHHESSNPFQWGTSVTLHRKRADIIAFLIGQESSDLRSEQDSDSICGDDEPEENEVDRQPFVKSQAMYHEWLANISNSAHNADETEESLPHQHPEEQHLPQLPDYEAFIRNSEAYRWLITKISQYESLAFAKDDIMCKIGSTIRDELRAQEPLRKMSHRAPVSIMEIQIKLDWHPRLFLEDQKLTTTPSNILDTIFCITGSLDEAQAMTVSEYMQQIWPMTSEAVLNLFNQLLYLPQDYQDTRYTQERNGLRLTAHADTSSSCVISIVAGMYYVSDVAEQIAWLVATLKPSSRNQTITVRFPRLERASAASTSTNISASKSVAVYTALFESDERTEFHEKSGLCWHSMFLGVNLVGGYPILRRPQPHTGLEISLRTLAYLVRSDHIVQYGKRIMMKGFNSLLIATSVTRSIVLWHLLVSSDPSERISYFDNRQDALEFMENGMASLRMLEKARHIIGWCPNVEELCGQKTAKRTISTSGLPNIPSSIVIDRMYIEGGMYAIAGVNMRFNQKEDPIRLLKDQDYPSLLKWIARHSVVFFDTSSLDRRAWLVDGASALLHLVRVSLHSDESNNESTFEWVFDASALKDDWPGCTGRQSAIKTLKDFDNLNLEVYVKKRLGSVTEFSTLWERIMKILHAMEILIETQQKKAEEGEIRTLQTLDRRKSITGFDILDVIEPSRSIHTRIAHFNSWGDGWIDMLPSIGATTLFGQGFGDLVLPKDLDSVCSYWLTVPTQKDYLCASISTLKMLYTEQLRRSGSTLGVGELTDKILWTSPSQPFDNCFCLERQTTSNQKHCDPIQFLVTSSKAWKSKLTFKDSAPIDLTTLDDTGAVIFANLGLLGRPVSARAHASIVEGATPTSSGSSAGQPMSVASISAAASRTTPLTGTTNTTDMNNSIQNIISSDRRDSAGAARIMPKQKARGRIGRLLGIFKKVS